MRPAKRDIDPDAKSHAGRHGDFNITWFGTPHVAGWWVIFDGNRFPIGPFHTSQAAFGAVKDAIDEVVRGQD